MSVSRPLWDSARGLRITPKPADHTTFMRTNVVIRACITALIRMNVEGSGNGRPV
jgi:hypothetical protein